MHKLMVLFRQPPDVLEFERTWSEDFVRLAERMPGLKRVSVSRVVGGPAGLVDLHLIHEFYFENTQALRSALSSVEGQAAGKALMSFAAGYASLCFAEHIEDDVTRRIATSD